MKECLRPYRVNGRYRLKSLTGPSIKIKN